MVDGRLTLWAGPVECGADGVEVFEVLRVEQGRGFGLNVLRGYLARTPRAAHHAATTVAAVRGARRKDRHPPVPKLPRLPLAAEERRWGHLRVGLAAALGLGLCESGVRRWCKDVGLDPDAGPVRLSDIIDLYRTRREPSVRRFTRQVVEAARSAGPAGSEAQPLVEGGLLVTAVRPVHLGPPLQRSPDRPG